MSKPIIEFKDFSFKYDAQKKPTLKHLNLTIHEGEKVLIAGLSGSGKSTIGHCLNGLIPNVYHGELEGECRIAGIDLAKASINDLSKVVGTVLQDSDGQFVAMTVAEDIAFSMENDCVDQKTMKQKVQTVAQKLDIEPLLNLAPNEISGGQKQRVALAGIMVDEVQILLFDEPLANLDPATGKHTIELIDEIAQKNDTTIVIIEHRIEDVLHRPVDRIVLIDSGEIVSDCSPDELLASNRLKEMGIREPLYLSALKSAGVQLNKEDHPADVRQLQLTAQQKEQVRAWTKANAWSHEEAKEVLLQLQDLSFSYDGLAKTIDHVSFDVHKGEMLAIIGKNGAGKSTLSKLLSGFIPLDGGRILLSGRDLKDDTIFERGQRIGLVLQNPNQMICNTMIFDEVAYGLRNAKVAEEEVTARVEEVLKICGLYAFRKWPISALSYGQKKRVTIASVLVMQPDVLVLDEPTAGQDYHHYTEIMTFLQKLNQQGNTLMIITHDMHLMLEYCSRALVILDGHKIFDGPCSDVMVNKEIIERANLKETSLYTLAFELGLDPKDVTLSYINSERSARHEG